jgi:hypothetical protein
MPARLGRGAVLAQDFDDLLFRDDLGEAVLLLRAWVDEPEARVVSFLFALLPLLLGAAGLFLYLRGASGRLRFHEAGLSVGGRRRRLELLYEEVGALTWRGAKEVICEPAPGVQKPALRYRAWSGMEDADLVAFRDFLASVLARRWGERLSREPVRWTARLRFLPGGLEYRPTGFLGPGEPLQAPYHMTGYRIQNGVFMLFVPGSARAALWESVGVANFYPGLMLLNWIYASYQSQQAGALAQQAPRPDGAGPSVKQPEERITAGGSKPGAVVPELPGQRPPG